MEVSYVGTHIHPSDLTAFIFQHGLITDPVNIATKGMVSLNWNDSAHKATQQEELSRLLKTCCTSNNASSIIINKKTKKKRLANDDDTTAPWGTADPTKLDYLHWGAVLCIADIVNAILAMNALNADKLNMLQLCIETIANSYNEGNGFTEWGMMSCLGTLHIMLFVNAMVDTFNLKDISRSPLLIPRAMRKRAEINLSSGKDRTLLPFVTWCVINGHFVDMAQVLIVYGVNLVPSI